MDQLLELLRSFDVATDADTYDLSALTDDQLAELHAAVLNLFDTVRDGDVPDIEALEQIASVSEVLLGEDNTRQEQAVADATRIAELEARVRPAGDPVPDPEAVVDPVVDPAADPVVDPEADPVADPAAVVDPAVEPVAVAAAATPRRVSLSQMAAQRRVANTPVPADAPGGDTATVVITAAADIPGVTAGSPLEGMPQVAQALHARVRSIDGHGIVPGQKFYAARIRREFPEDRQLSANDALGNERRIEVVVASARQGFRDGAEGGFESLVAAGGLCTSLPVSFAQETIGSTGRPIRDGLPGFDGSRGGVRFTPGPTLADIDLAGSDAAVGVWTMEQDEAAINDSGTRKPIQRITCGTETTVETYAVTDRFRVGNVLARTNPERVAAFLRLAEVAHARMAEGRLAGRIKSLSTETLEETQVLGSARDILVAMRKAGWAVRNRNRMDRGEPLQGLVPDAVVEQFQSDLSRQMPGDGTLSVAVAEIEGYLRDAGIQAIFSPDLPGHLAAAQAAGAQLTDLPSPIEWGVWPMGVFGHIDGGQLDLGFAAGTPIRDSDLNAANDYELFAEEWENIAKFGGPQSLWVRSFVCPTGEVAGTVDVSCDTAS